AVTSLAAVPLNVEAGATRLCSTENARIGRVERALDTRHKREVVPRALHRRCMALALLHSGWPVCSTAT
ncbi:MAG: hypothetical protein ACI9BK_001515, partial [Acidimicrobiales bacterium]